MIAYGPATFADVRWWTGWGVRETRTALGDKQITARGRLPTPLERELLA